MAKTFHIMSPGPKWVRLEKEYSPYEWTSGNNIRITDYQESDLLVGKRMPKNQFWLSYNMLKNVPYIVPNFLDTFNKSEIYT